ncbi:hypothetical protein H8356DRAFT_1687434, partial [Neocallimastix lanati (nom. inval.)]
VDNTTTLMMPTTAVKSALFLFQLFLVTVPTMITSLSTSHWPSRRNSQIRLSRRLMTFKETTILLPLSLVVERTTLKPSVVSSPTVPTTSKKPNPLSISSV